MLRVLVVDDHSVIRMGLRCAIGKADGIEIAGEASNGAEALEALRRGGFDVMMLDMKLPDMSGIDVMVKARQTSPSVPVVIYTMHSETSIAVMAFKAGAAGFINKSDEPSEMVSAIQKVARGQRYVSPAMAESLVDYIDAGGGKLPHERLTRREMEILSGISSGRTSKEIAHVLSLSVKTVSTHKMNIMRKLNFKSNADIIKYAMDHHISA